MGKKKKSRRQGTDAGLSITSMMDMMTIILVFLLKNYLRRTSLLRRRMTFRFRCRWRRRSQSWQ